MRILIRATSSICLAFLCVISFPTTTLAQASIAGIVRDTSGAVLPGVTVEASSPALIEKVRVVSTDGSGQYRVVDLRPGVYTVTFSLAGFSSISRQGVELTGSFNATVNADLRVGSLEESITVTGETATVDIQSVTRQRVFNQQVLESIPAGRSHLNIAVLIPGLNSFQTGRGATMDVGGTNNLPNSFMTIHGSRSEDARIYIDGVRIGNLSWGNTTNFVPDMGAAQEVTIDYGAGAGELMSGGPKIELIPKEGGNTFRGSFFATGVNASFQGDNYSDDLKAKRLGEPNSLYRMYDVNPSGGGPIVRDKLWFYSSARWQSNQSYVAGLYANKNANDPSKWTYEPDLSDRAIFFMTQKSANTRLTWQASQRNKFGFLYEGQGRVWDDMRPAVSPESVIKWRFPVLRLSTTLWSAPVTNKLLLDARYSNRGEEYMNAVPAIGDPLRVSVPVMEQSTGLFYRGPGNRSAEPYPHHIMPNIHTVMTSVSYVTGAHAFKVGFNNTWGTRTVYQDDDDYGYFFRFNNGVPNRITLRATPYETISKLNAELGAFVQDRWTLSRLTINGGLRFDYYKVSYPEQHVGPGPLVPNRNLTYPEQTSVNWKDASPRLGVSYDLFGNGKTALKASAGRYVIAQSVIAGYNNPILNRANQVFRSWNDANRDYVPDCDIVNPVANGECGALSDLRFGQPTASTAYDPGVLGGWATRPYNWEVATSVEHELIPRVGLNVGYFRRWYGNFQVTDNRAVTPGDFSPFSVTAPVDSRLPGGGGYVVSDLYNLNPNKVGQVDNYFTAASAYGKQIEHWNGVDVTVNARLPQSVLLQGGFSTGRTSTDNCEVLAALPELNPLGRPYCHVDTAFLTQVKLLGTYTIPRVALQVAATFQSVPGPEILANYIATNAQITPSLGRPLSAGAPNATINVVRPGSLYGQTANQLDFRLSRTFPYGRVRTTVNLDLYNVLNANPVLLQNDNFAVWQTPQRIMEARLFKISAQLNF